jgi:beta-1,4-glucosyltransferase
MPLKSEPTIRLGGFQICNVDFEGASSLIHASLSAGNKMAVLFANTHFVTVCQHLHDSIDEHPSALVLNDGIGINIASFLVHRRWFPHNLNGTDFIPRLLRESEQTLRIFLLGGSQRANAGAATAFANFPRITIAGTCDGYSFWSNPSALIAEINRSNADIVLVALGSPTQESWIVENWRQVQAPVIFGVGALFDFMSQQRARAPSLIRRMNLEWLFRLVNEPRRLGYRYTIEIFSFVRIVIVASLAPHHEQSLGTAANESAECSSAFPGAVTRAADRPSRNRSAC